MDRVLAGLTVTVCSAVVVVLLGLVADAAAGPVAPEGPAPVPATAAP